MPWAKQAGEVLRCACTCSIQGFSQSMCPGRNGALNRDRGCTGPGEHVQFYLMHILFLPFWDCRGLCWASAALPSGCACCIATGLWQLPLHCVPSLSPHHAHLTRGYSLCACAVQKSSFSSLFPPAQTRAETLPSRKACPRTGWVQSVQSSDEISSRPLWSVKGKAAVVLLA